MIFKQFLNNFYDNSLSLSYFYCTCIISLPFSIVIVNKKGGKKVVMTRLKSIVQISFLIYKMSCFFITFFFQFYRLLH